VIAEALELRAEIAAQDPHLLADEASYVVAQAFPGQTTLLEGLAEPHHGLPELCQDLGESTTLVREALLRPRRSLGRGTGRRCGGGCGGSSRRVSVDASLRIRQVAPPRCRSAGEPGDRRQEGSAQGFELGSRLERRARTPIGRDHAQRDDKAQHAVIEDRETRQRAVRVFSWELDKRPISER
jgi:hypothetical protein